MLDHHGKRKGQNARFLTEERPCTAGGPDLDAAAKVLGKEIKLCSSVRTYEFAELFLSTRKNNLVQ